MSDIGLDYATAAGKTGRRFVEDERGMATAWNLMWLVGFCVMGGLAIDSTNAFRHKAMLQSTADTAALAAAMELPAPGPVTGDFNGTDYDQVRYNAQYYAYTQNMGTGLGTFFDASAEGRRDIEVGYWDPATRTFVDGSALIDASMTPVNAVRVKMGLSFERDNPVATTLLRMLPKGSGETRWGWDINVTATAVAGLPDCYVGGLVARGQTHIGNNNVFFPGMCIHSEGGLAVSPNNCWWPGVAISSPSPALDQIQTGGSDSNVGLTVSRGSLQPAMVDEIPRIANELLRGTSNLIHQNVDPSYPIDTRVIEMTELTLDSNTAEIETGVRFAALGNLVGFAARGGNGASDNGGSNNGGGGNNGGSNGGGGNGGGPGRQSNEMLDRCIAAMSGVQPRLFNDTVYQHPHPVPDFSNFDVLSEVQFDRAYGSTTATLERNRIYYQPSNRKLTIDGTLEDVTIITRGNVQIRSGAKLHNVVLVSLDGGENAVTIGDADIGRKDDCTPGGGSKIISLGTIRGSSGTSWNGSMVIAAGDVHLAAHTDGIRGISAHIGGDLHWTSNGSFGASGNTAYGIPPDISCSEGVDVGFTKSAYRHVLVD